MGKFVKACAVTDLQQDDLLALELEGRRVLVINLEGQIYAVEGVCTHEDADLGTLNSNRILCPVHLSQFDVVTGEPVSPPATVPLPVFKVKVEGSEIYVELPEEAGKG